MKVYSTTRHIEQLINHTFEIQSFIRDAKAFGAEALHVDTRFFPERAMYWTRMLRNAADAQGMSLSLLELSSELIGSEDVVEAQRLNLSEWIRIAALSRIKSLKIHIDGSKYAQNPQQALVSALEPLVPMACRYGTLLVLAGGGAGLTDAQLLGAAKTLGYGACRVSPVGKLSGADVYWIG